jgi:hypothetical protein
MLVHGTDVQRRAYREGLSPHDLGRTGRPPGPGLPKVRWKLVWEFLEEYRWEQAGTQPSLLQDEPAPVGDEWWDALLAALAEHLAAELDLAPPPWAESRVLRQPWFPAELQTSRPGLWRGLQQRSANMASTCRPGAWTPRDRS